MRTEDGKKHAAIEKHLQCFTIDILLVCECGAQQESPWRAAGQKLLGTSR